jgi:serine/threonine protein kinase
VTDYDPRVQGLPPDDFPWADYDLVLLDHELQAEQTGLDWLRRFGRVPGFPGVIFATGAGDENLAARAMKFGADEYLSKRDMTPQRLGELVSSVMAERSVPASGAASTPPPVRPRPGTEGLPADPVPEYHLRRLLGCGGSADVYLAERRADGLTVVLKILREGMRGSELAIKRLLFEADLLGSIDSPQVVRVYGHGLVDGRAYMVMEYLGHGDLRARIAEGLDLEQALHYATEVARGLATVHAHGVVHRDIKPANVNFRYDDSVALTDFGIARQMDNEQGLTSHGSVVGTPSYMSPEQCDGSEVDARSDLYSLGVMFFEMLTGSRPFSGESANMLLMQHAVAPVPALPEPLARYQQLVETLMAKDPAERYADAEAFLGALERIRA